MCSGLPALPDSQEPWTLLPPPGLATALLAVGMGDSLVGRACSLRAHCRMTENRLTKGSSQEGNVGRG